MIETGLWIAAGGAAGVIQIVSLRRAACALPAHVAASAPLRLLLVVGCFVAAARCGFLPAATLGWAAAFSSGSFLLARKSLWT